MLAGSQAPRQAGETRPRVKKSQATEARPTGNKQDRLKQGNNCNRT